MKRLRRVAWVLTPWLWLLAPAALAGGGPRAATSVTLDALDGAMCQPLLGRVVFGVTPDAAASRRMAEMFSADQAARQVGPGEQIDWAVVSRQDEQRRVDALALLKAGRLNSAQDYVHAAYVFQHGDCPQHYRLANLLAAQAIARGEAPGSTPDPQTRWLYAATYDRWLTSQGKPQKYGTQYLGLQPCELKLMDYDPATTDAQRAEYDVPPLSEALADAERMNADCKSRRQP